jgi:hypothetical protein
VRIQQLPSCRIFFTGYSNTTLIPTQSEPNDDLFVRALLLLLLLPLLLLLVLIVPRLPYSILYVTVQQWTPRLVFMCYCFPSAGSADMRALFLARVLSGASRTGPSSLFSQTPLPNLIPPTRLKMRSRSPGTPAPTKPSRARPSNS